jgi:predicted phage terminase large subunit-like protein
LIEELRVETNLPIVPYRPDHDKLARAYAIEPVVASGRLFLPVGDAPWLEQFITELIAFPAGQHDDQVDAVTMALSYLRTTPQSYFVVSDWSGRVT